MAKDIYSDLKMKKKEEEESEEEQQKARKKCVKNQEGRR